MISTGGSYNMDTHVLEETVARVDALAENMAKSVRRISTRTARARKSLAPVAQHSRGFEQYEKNVSLVLDSLEELKKYSTAIGNAGARLQQGPQAGLSEFENAQTDLERALTAFNNSEFRKFTGISTKARALLQDSYGALSKYLIVMLNRAYPPPNLQEYLAGKGEPLKTDPAKLSAVRGVVDVYDRAGMSDEADAVLNAAYAEYIGHALRIPTTELNSEVIKVYADHVRNVSGNLESSIRALFGDNNERIGAFTAVVHASVKGQQERVSQSLASSSDQGDGLAVFDSIESASLLGSSVTELTTLAQEGLAKLKSIYLQIEQVTKQGRVESETSVTGSTVKTLSSIRGLSRHHKGVSLCLQQFPVRAYLPSPPPEWVSKVQVPETAAPEEIYFADSLESLYAQLVLVARGAGFRPTQQGIFLLFNLATVEHYLELNHLGAVMGSLVQERLDKNTKQAFKLFLADWEQLSQQLLDQTITASKPGAKLSNKDREAIKDRFRQFNNQFDLLIENQRKYNVTDAVLRKRIAHEISKLIRPLYKRFYDKHSGGDFTKNVDKYIRYDPKQLDETLQSIA